MQQNNGRRLLTVRHVAAAIAWATVLGTTASGQLASRPVEEWLKVLDAEERVAGLKTAEVVASLKLKPGDVVADLGAGAGPFVVPFARAVARTGRVYAVEIDRNFFPYIDKRAKAAGVANVQTVLGEFTDPRLPAANLDLAFMHDVLHHVANRPAYLKSAAKYLKPGARIAIIDYHPAQSPHRDDPSLVISKEQATAWLADAGFEPVDDVALFKDKWFVVFAKR
jgi:ubiquinone/menaquinone biosynthesis C-methylase UbiE